MTLCWQTGTQTFWLFTTCQPAENFKSGLERSLVRKLEFKHLRWLCVPYSSFKAYTHPHTPLTHTSNFQWNQFFSFAFLLFQRLWRSLMCEWANVHDHIYKVSFNGEKKENLRPSMQDDIEKALQRYICSPCCPTPQSYTCVCAQKLEILWNVYVNGAACCLLREQCRFVFFFFYDMSHRQLGCH